MDYESTALTVELMARASGGILTIHPPLGKPQAGFHVRKRIAAPTPRTSPRSHKPTGMTAA